MQKLKHWIKLYPRVSANSASNNWPQVLDQVATLPIPTTQWTKQETFTWPWPMADFS